MKIPLAKPWFDEADEQAVLQTLRSGWVGAGPKVASFEARFGEYVGVSHAVAVSSCTAALHLAACAAGFGPGDEVLVPAFTWVSTANAIEMTGAPPVFCDIDPLTFNIDPGDAARRITSRTRGIIAVHLFGLAADMATISRLADKHGLFVIEDAACALGTYVGDRHVGTLGNVGCFSFHPRKSITTGEGGMLVTGDGALATVFQSLRDIGSDRAGLSAERAALQLLPDYPRLGYNYRLTDLQAALGETQLAKFGAILEMRLACARRYDELIGRSSLSQFLVPPKPPEAREHSYQAYVCMLQPPALDTDTLSAWHARRNRWMQKLSEAGIATRPGTHAPHMLSYYQGKYGLRAEDCPAAWRAEWLSIALPLYAGLSQELQERVVLELSRQWHRAG